MLEPLSDGAGSVKSHVSSFVGINIGGEKTIGFWGGFNLLANNICGPAIVLLPALFQQAGIIPTTIGLILITILAGICSWMMVEAMKLMPNNKDLTHRHEYLTVAQRYLTPIHFWTVFIFYQASAMSILMSNVIQTAQVLDIAIADIFGCSYGLEYYPFDKIGFPCGDDTSSNSEPWDSGFIFSIGFLIVALISIPLGILNLDDNIILQWIATVGFALMAIVWIGIFVTRESWDTNNVPWATTHLSQLVGVILFNYGYIVTLPSWANEKKPHVSTTNTLIVSLGFMLVIFYIVGIFGGMAYRPYYKGSDDIFDKLNTSNLTAKITVYLEPIIQNITSIPIFSIVMRYNFLDAGFSKFTANFWSVIFPWILSIPFYNGNGFQNLCNVGGVVVAAYVNFIIPPYLYIWAYMEDKVNNEITSISDVQQIANVDTRTSSISKSIQKNKNKIQVVDTQAINYKNTDLQDDDTKNIFKGDHVQQFKHSLALAWGTYIIMWIISLVGIFFTFYT